MSTRSLFTRRQLLGHAGGGLLAGAVSGLLGRDAFGAPRRTAPVIVTRKSRGAWTVLGCPSTTWAAESPTSRTGTPAFSSHRAMVAS